MNGRHPNLFLLLPALLVIIVFLVLPTAWLIRASFFPQDRLFEAEGWSLVHYAKAFGDTFYLSVLLDTFMYGAIVTCGTAAVGFPVGYALARGLSRPWHMFIVVLPLTLSLVVNVFGWLVILGRGGLLNSMLLGLGLIDEPIRFLFTLPAVLLVLGHTFLPFQILAIMSVVTQIDPVLEQAAQSLRASRWTTFSRIVLPLAWPGIAAGSTVVFMLTISAFVTPRLIGGTHSQMLGSIIFEQIIVALNWPFGAALAVMLLAMALLVGIIAGRRRRTSVAAWRAG
jgi:putative spermidine/putrescine transport system permease protein